MMVLPRNMAGRYADALTLIQTSVSQIYFIIGQIYFGGN